MPYILNVFLGSVNARSDRDNHGLHPRLAFGLEGYEHIDAAMIGALAERLSNGAKPILSLPENTTSKDTAKDPAKALAALKRKIRKLGRELDSETAASTRDKLLALALS